MGPLFARFDSGRPPDQAHEKVDMPGKNRELQKEIKTKGGDLKELIRQLINLQEKDIERLTLEGEKQGLWEKVDKMQNLLTEMDRDLSEKKDRLKEAQRWYQEKEREMKENDDQIKKLQARLNLVTKAKEYAILQKELEEHRRTNQHREEEVLKLLSAMEEFQGSVEEEAKKWEELRKKVVLDRKATEKRSAEIDKSLNVLESVVVDMEPDIPKNILSKYKRIQGAWKGLAVVEVNIQNGSCGGCHRQIPPQLFNVLLQQKSLEQCPHCQRFIFVDIDKMKNNEQ